MKMEFYKIHFENKSIKKEINLNILGKEFFLNNKNKGKIIYENKKYDFADFFKIKNAQKNEIKVKIILDEYCPNRSFMFNNWDTISKISIDIIELKDNFNEKIIKNEELYSNKILDFSSVSNNDDSDFYGNSNSDTIISEVTLHKKQFENNSTIKQNKELLIFNNGLYKEINIINMHKMFCGCTSLKSLNILSNWNIENSIDMSYMFKNCSISSLPDILSKWNTTNIIDMSFYFVIVYH